MRQGTLLRFSALLIYERALKRNNVPLEMSVELNGGWAIDRVCCCASALFDLMKER